MKGLLENYAEYLDRTPGRLRFFDIYDQTGEITSKLYHYINETPRRAEQTAQRLKNYQSEIRSNLRHLSKELLGLIDHDHPQKSFDEPHFRIVPEGLRPILIHLPRENLRYRVKPEGLSRFPVSGRGLLALSAMINVWKRQNYSRLEDLFKDIPLIRQEIFHIEPSHLAVCAVPVVYRLRIELGFEKSSPRTTNCLRVEEWPQPLRQEWETFEKLATEDVGADSNLRILAEKHKFSVKELSPETINGYRLSLGYALGVFRPRGSFSVLEPCRPDTARPLPRPLAIM